jgi:hypothetical protein
MSIRITVEVDNLKELFRAAHVTSKEIADHLGISDTGMSFRLTGRRPFFRDEITPLARAIEAGGKAKVTASQVAKIIGPERIVKRQLSR